MAVRLAEHLVGGELLNTGKNTVHGWLELRGREHPIMLHLTGNCDPDLAGWHIRFEARPQPAPDADEPELPKLASQQVGPTGTMTAARMVKTFDGPIVEAYERTKLGEPPPFEWKRCLYLEWYSQNGRVVIELADPIIEFVERVELPDVPMSDADPRPPGPTEADAAPALQVTTLRIDEDGDGDVEEDTYVVDEDEEDDEPDDPYGLFPDDLQRRLDAQSREQDGAVTGDDDDVVRELELMDELIESGPGEPIHSIFDAAVRLPRPEKLDDDQVEAALKTLLGQLALYGIALDMCEHFTPRDAYTLLLDDICKREHAYRELRRTQWVQHFATWEYCDICQDEMEAEMDSDEETPMPDDGNDPMPF